VGVDCGGGGEDRGGFAWALIAAAVGERGLNRGRTTSTVDAYSRDLRSSIYIYIYIYSFLKNEALLNLANYPGDTIGLRRLPASTQLGCTQPHSHKRPTKTS
jgi:hypothetical protein